MSLPAPTLPKGGGALRGIGETFTVSAPRGTASLAIPLPSTPIPGLAPALTLAYDSGGGNGPFGLGMDCPVPCIQRRTDRGVPRHDDRDVFVLSGADDLVRVGDGPVDPQFRIERYQPRREGLWARIERLTPLAGGTFHWRVTTRDGVVHRYGPDAASRLADPADARRVQRWCLAESRDDKGHVVRYQYQADAGNLYLERVLYANEVGRDDAFHVRVVFEYGDRLDPFSSHRAGFEVRTRRLCQRVLLSHRFPELGPSWELVRELRLGYQPSPIATLLTSAQVVGHRPGEAELALPPLTLDWIPIELGQTVTTLADAPTGDQLRFVDLDADGLPGVLRQHTGGWFYQRNDGGRLGRAREVASIPAAGLAGGHELADLRGDGELRLVRHDLSGFHRRTQTGWTGFTPFAGVPAVDRDEVRFVDLTGDGLPDVVRCDPEALTWYRSLGEAGWDAPEQGPGRVLTDGSNTLVFADMSGDGLADLVRILDGAVTYWPNRGHGRFGDAVVMRDAPRFGEGYDPARLRLADVDGTGTTDILYLGDDGVVTWWVNQAGNGFGAPRTIPLPLADRLADVQLVDLLGKGTPCLVWSSRGPDGGVRYVDLLPRGKPHLLERTDNGLGLERRLEYRPSTRFAADDRAAGRPWLTRLPFPVQLLARVVTREQTTGATLTQTYRYHHGHWDARERELAGFGMVEVEDAELAPDLPPGLAAIPARTRTWYHTGALDGEELLARAYAREYTGGDRLPDTALPADLTAAERHDAARALRGQVVRTEVFGVDHALPYVVSESSWVVRRVAPRVFAVRAGETATFHHERQAGDARVRHELVLAADAFDQVTERAEVSYPRALPVESAQGRLDVVIQRSDLVNDLARHRLGIAVETSQHEITGLVPAAALFRPGELAGAAGKLLAREQTLFWKDDLTGPLPHRDPGARALPHSTRRLAFVDLVLHGGRVSAALAALAKYQADAGGFWAPSAVTEYDAAQRFRPVRQRDPFGNTAEVRWWHALVADRLTDARGHQETATIDPVTLTPIAIEDANGARSGVVVDPLGRVRATWRTGRDGEGDSPAQPGSTIEYRLGALPISTRVRAREQHAVPEPDEPANPRWREIVTYQDGLGRDLLVKTSAEQARWAATGHVVRDNKGQPVIAYEPYFAGDDGFQIVAAGKPAFYRFDPLGRQVRAERADGAFREVVHRSAWETEHRDENDTLLASRWYQDRKTRSDAVGDAARATEAHADTGEITRVDAAGRVVATLRDDGANTLTTRVDRDVLGRERKIENARAEIALEVERDLLGQTVRAWTPDGGEVRTFADAMGRPFRAWDAAGREIATVHDALSRPIETWVDGRLVARTEYGDRSQADARTRYRIGRPARVWDGAGLETYDYDFKGNRRRCVRQFFAGTGEPDWQSATVSAESWVTSARFDAMGRAWSVTAIDGTTTRTGFNEAGLVETLTATLPDGVVHPLIAGCAYDARGQRTEVRWSNGAFTTTYVRDDETGRLIAVETTRPSGPKLQDLAFVHDPVGNVTHIADAALADVYFRNRRVGGEASFVYDPLYRLRRAIGREHASFGDATQTAAPGARTLFDPADGQALVQYQEDYDFDELGNLRSLAHQVLGGARWTRTYRYPPGTSQLTRTELTPTSGLDHGHDACGNLDGIPHLGKLTYDQGHRLVRVELKDGRTVEYGHDGEGRRVRTVVRDGANVLRETLVAGGAEIRREGTLERRTLHVADEQGRFALIERRTAGSDRFPGKTLRFQLGNHIGSAMVELDAAGALLTYEEFHPYGTTAYHAEAIEVGRKRWRWAGKERDEETGLVDFGARWYAPWLGRWTAKDPSLQHGVSPYEYCSGNPVSRVDPDGREDVPPDRPGLYNREVSGRLADAFTRIYRNWDSYRNDTARLNAMNRAVNAALKELGVPRPELHPNYRATGATGNHGETNTKNWRISNIDPSPIRGGRPAFINFIGFAGTWAHEAQHLVNAYEGAKSWQSGWAPARRHMDAPDVPKAVMDSARKARPRVSPGSPAMERGVEYIASHTGQPSRADDVYARDTAADAAVAQALHRFARAFDALELARGGDAAIGPDGVHHYGLGRLPGVLVGTILRKAALDAVARAEAAKKATDAEYRALPDEAHAFGAEAVLQKEMMKHIELPNGLLRPFGW